MRYSHLIWDWNGTLLDDTQLCFEIANDMRLERGMELLPSLTAYREAFRFPIRDYYRAMGYTFTHESYEAVSVEFIRLYAERVPLCPLREGAIATLETVRRAGIPQTLLSATMGERLILQAGRFNLGEYFVNMCGLGNDLAFSKADLAKAYLQTLGEEPERVLFVGDTDHDRQVAREAGCDCVLLCGGHQNPDRLLAQGVPVAEDFAALRALLERR